METNIYVHSKGRVSKDITKPERGMNEMSEKETKGEGEIESVIKHNQAEIMAKNFQLTAAVNARDVKIKELTADLKAATEQLENKTRSIKIDRILQVSNLGLGYLADRSLDELDEIEEIYKHVKTPRFKSTGDNSRFADEHDQILYKLNNMYKFDKK